MRRVTLVRRRDGETVPFDETRVVDAIERALAAAGGRDPELASEIAGVVGLFLEKTYYDEVPGIEQVEDMVEKVLLETGHAEAAKAFILHRERRSRLRAARQARDGYAEPTLFDPRAIVVDDTATGTSAPYSREALARALVLDGLLPRPVADEVAAVVEEKLRRAGVSRAPASLVRSLAESEVLAHDAPVDLRRRGAAMLFPEAIDLALHRRAGRGAGSEAPPTPARAARDLGEMALTSHALGDLLPSDVARAHLDGDVFVHGLALPGAVFCASFSPEDVKRGVAPGSGARGPEDVALTPRRLAAATGRCARLLSEATSHGAALSGAALAFAPLCSQRALEVGPQDEIAEDAWHLLMETSCDPGASRLELDLTPDVPDTIADEAAVGGAGEPLSVPNGELGGVATSFASAVLRAHARGAGLPSRDLLPVPVVGISERTLGGAASRGALRLAAEIALRGERVVLPLLRDRGPFSGTSAARGRGARASCCAGRVTLNLPRAARRAGRGNVEGFLRECDRLVDLAVAAHRSRRDLLALASAAPGGPLAPLFRAGRGRGALLDLSQATWSVAATGLNEALSLLTGFELHEGDDHVARVAKRIASYLAVRVKAAGMSADFTTTLDADDDPEPARRFLVCDRRQEPERMGELFPSLAAYTAGAGVRGDAPVDLLLRIEREDPLHAYFTTATMRLPVPLRNAGGPDGLLALAAKCLRAGSAQQTEFRVW